jgi:hypothetical protein
LKTIKSTIQEFNPKLISEEQAKIAEFIVNHSYKTLAADPGRLVQRLQEIINTC